MMKTSRLILLGTVLALSSLSLSFIISETSPKPEIPKTPNSELIDGLIKLGCTESAINHLLRASNLLDDSFDGTYIINDIGYPDDLSQVEFDKCVKIILEKRISNVENSNHNVPIVTQIGKTGIYKLDYGDKIFEMYYSIKDANIDNMVFSNSTNSLLIEITSVHQGNLEIIIPRELLDAKMDYCPPRMANSPDDKFFVLLDGEEIWYDEIKTTPEYRTLQISFSDNATKIEVIGTCLI